MKDEGFNERPNGFAVLYMREPKMSKTYRCRVKKDVRVVSRASDEVEYKVSLLDILNPEEMEEQYRKALQSMGAKETADGFRAEKDHAPIDDLLLSEGQVDFEVVRDDERFFCVKFVRYAINRTGHADITYFGQNYLKSAGRRIVIAEQPRREIGRRAARLLIDRIEGIGTGTVREEVLPVRITTIGGESRRP